MTKDELHAFLHEHSEAGAPPASTYRLQLNGGFPFREAASVIPYLKELGTAAVYCSPWFAAVPGSLHGYDVTDYAATNPELGTPQDFDEFCAALAEHGLRHIADMVPNHMGIGRGNRLWLDVLENGQASVFARFFDINWDPVKKDLRGKILLPILGDHYGRALENQDIQLEFAGGGFRVRYRQSVLPVDPQTYPLILAARPEELESRMGKDHPDLAEHLSIVTAFRNLPGNTETDPGRMNERGREKEVAKGRLAALAERSAAIGGHLSEQVRRYNGGKGQPRSFDDLDALLSRQVYRMAHWKVASDEINYRRFFDINELAAIRMEDPQVFASCHRLMFRLIGEGKVHGLRIDHPDGLYDPPTYFRRLQQRYLAGLVLAQKRAAGSAGPARVEGVQPAAIPEDLQAALDSPEFRNAAPFPVAVEKILDRKESLPENWCVHGTVGYDFLNALNGLFVDPEAEKAFTALYEEFIGQKIDFDELVYRSKQRFALLHMASEIEDLGHRLDRISEQSRRYRDFTRNNLVLAIRETISCFPVYRTYISPEDVVVSDRDARYIRIAAEKAKSRTPALDPTVYDFLRDVLLLLLEAEVGGEERGLYRDFVMRFQQLTGPVMAKGMEDTAFYIYNRLLSLNEVGGDPTHFGFSPEDFHRQNASRAKRWPAGFITGSTHDAKRGEDVRLRLDVLSEMPKEWQTMISQWALANKKHKPLVRGFPEPRPDTEYMIYQTLLGVWPDPHPQDQQAFEDRLWQVVLKALREAKSDTDWTRPNLEYEEALRSFLHAILAPGADNHFLENFLPVQARIADLGRWNSLSALTLRLGSPGVVDTYQGTELWDLTLVDPDNRRPVDFAARRRMLAELMARLASGEPRQAVVEDLARSRADGRLKLFLLRQGLSLRGRRPGLFVGGEYIPLETAGEMADHVVSFQRRNGPDLAVAAGGRFFARLAVNGPRPPVGDVVWGDTVVILPDGVSGETLTDVFSGRRIVVHREGGAAFLRVGEMFESLSAALLTNVPDS
jgi:(1->4)-alpha-D-glucan 1-alpha-D-glucosylmutase